MNSAYMFAGIVVSSRISRFGMDTELEASEVVELHTLGVLELVAHHLHEFSEHCEHVTAFHGTVTLYNLSEIIGSHHSGIYCASHPFADICVSTF